MTFKSQKENLEIELTVIKWFCQRAKNRRLRSSMYSKAIL